MKKEEGIFKITFCQNPKVIKVLTKFNIKEHSELKTLIEKINGVEESYTFGCAKYDFIVCFGEMFEAEDIKVEVESTIKEYLKNTLLAH